VLLKPFLGQAEQRPGAIALVEGERVSTYGELRQRALAITARLRALSVGPGERVAIHLERGIDAVVAIFGVLLAGACYVPLDLKNPPARRAFILNDAAVSAVIGLGERPADLEGMVWLDVSAATGEPARGVEMAGGEMAAILYTSGSTGRPKGVALAHGAIAAFAEWAARLVNLGPDDRIASSTPFFFDLSTFDLYAALGRGASLHFVPTPLFLAPARLGAWAGEQAISGWYTVPSLLAFLAYKGNLSQAPPVSLRFLFFAGEVFPTPALRALADALPRTALFNFYGPTETNVCCYWPVDRARLDAAKPIPIGQPAAGDELRIESETGELWVRGPTVASGYWSEGRLQPLLNGEGWYPTGDRVSRNEAGEYLFHERLGRMLKCSGYRVEPAEIEAALRGLAGVIDCAVVGIADPAAGQRPVAALVLHPTLTVTEVQKTLQSILPAYMQPARYRLLDELPRLANGKLDYPRVQALLEEA
jgi:amino acid adenylation domain-containing protein